jgi:DNA-directed RNA polymerase specialized sigma subunit
MNQLTNQTKPNQTINNNTNFIPEKVSNLEKLILDELSDGQWHPEYKIKKEIGESKIIEVLTDLEEKDILLSGVNNSFRMNSSILPTWRSYTDFPKKNDARYTPRVFGGILEDDGWAMAELKNYDLIHFRTNGDISKGDIEKIISYSGLVTRSEDGLYRIFVKDSGDDTYNVIKNYVFSEPNKSFSGVRLEKDIKRRDLKDLDRKYFSDLCQYYGNFAKVLLKSNMSSITKHIAEPDDIQQQINLWVIDAVQRYDNTTSIPFAAYLGKSLSNWVFNLNRQSFGRSAADVELKHSRAANQFRTEYSREPTIEELAEVLGEDVENVKNERISIHSVSNIRTMGTIDSDETIIHIASSEDTTSRLEEQSHQYLLSQAITASALRENDCSPNLVGWIHVYHSTWGNSKNKKFLPIASSEETKIATEKLFVKTRNKLKETGAY